MVDKKRTPKNWHTLSRRLILTAVLRFQKAIKTKGTKMVVTNWGQFYKTVS
jgi:hypothetical protein